MDTKQGTATVVDLFERTDLLGAGRGPQAARRHPKLPPKMPTRLRRTVTRDLAPPILVRWVRRRRRERVHHG